MRLGLDFGGVIVAAVEAAPSGEDTALGGSRFEPSDARQMPGAFAAIAELNELLSGELWIVSKAGPRMQRISREWFAAQRFFETTAVDPTHLHFCIERADKRPICEALALTHFVDDRVALMHVLRGAVANLYQMSTGGERARAEPWYRRVTSWSELLPLLRAECARD